MNLKEGQAPAPIGKSTSDQDLEIEMGDLKILDDDGSPLPVSDFSSPGGDQLISPEDSPGPVSPAVKAKREGGNGETSSNVSTSTPEGDVLEESSHNDAAPREGVMPPVFSGVG